MSEAIYLKIPRKIKEDADLYVKSGYFDNRSELIREALREYLQKLQKHGLSVAVDLYRRGDISLGKASEIAGVGYEKMKAILAEKEIPLNRGPRSRNELEGDVKSLG